MALDAGGGSELWRTYPGGNLTGAPMTYMLGGRQYVITAVDSVLYAWALPEDSGVESTQLRGLRVGRVGNGT